MLSALTDDTQVALSALFARLVESPGHPVATTRVLALERTIIAVRFGGSRSRYLSALRARGASLAVARAIIADQLRRQDIAKRRDVPVAYVGRDLALPLPLWRAAREAGASRQHRVVARRQAPRVHARPAGAAAAADAARARSRRALVTTNGPVKVTALDEVLPLGAVPLSLARPAVRAALTAQGRLQAVETWSVGAQSRALSRILCVGDVLPASATVDLSSYLPVPRARRVEPGGSSRQRRGIPRVGDVDIRPHGQQLVCSQTSIRSGREVRRGAARRPGSGPVNDAWNSGGADDGRAHRGAVRDVALAVATLFYAYSGRGATNPAAGRRVRAPDRAVEEELRRDAGRAAARPPARQPRGDA